MLDSDGINPTPLGSAQESVMQDTLRGDATSFKWLPGVGNSTKPISY